MPDNRKSRQHQHKTKQRRLWLRSLVRTTGHSFLRGAAGAMGASVAGWIIWWIQQH
ncbi:hypothetical protein JK359_33185 [Streptomyces actinomycinicus]|uniref:Uncharacterized protein n=1 Tax=Streptomyces actinomycinicus TaxID=1695166 RepID=A0A937EQN3_9ACTN|nr:hypothetical protein [Streptomyces actinomycinicus]MBL1086762.1 hypothetical protein [Streptomyces actinomycinicus]